MRCLALLLLLVAVSSSFAGIAKRDTVSEIEESLNDAMENNFNIPNTQEVCVMDSHCIEPIQYCNKDNILNPHCSFHLWMWVAAAAVCILLFVTLVTSCLCCPCCCLYSLCRKK